MRVTPSGAGAVSLEEPTFDAVHTLALRHGASPLPPGGETLLSRGLAEPSGPGFLLTSEGYRVHRALLDRERASIDIATLGMAYAPIALLSRRLAHLRDRWHAMPVKRPDLVTAFSRFVGLAQAPLLRASAIVPRFAGYGPRLSQAVRRLEAGELRYAVDPDVDSVMVIWQDLHEDYLQTLGRGYEVEGL